MVTKLEFVEFLMGIEKTQDKVTLLFRVYDDNDDEVLDMKEIEKVLW